MHEREEDFLSKLEMAEQRDQLNLAPRAAPHKTNVLFGDDSRPDERQWRTTNETQHGTISPLAENPVADWLAIAGVAHVSGLAEAVENQVGRNLAKLKGLSDAEIDAMLAPLSMGRVPMKEVKTALKSLRGQVIVDNGAALDDENRDEETVVHVLSPVMDATPAEEL